jgi:Acetoacetate decarboxylase (ADC)
MSDTATTVWGEIQGQEITFPMEVTEMNSATLLFTVPLGAAAALLPGDAFEVIETAPGSAQLVVALVDYLENPWGDYDEVNLGFLARPAGAPEDVVGSFIYRMPVNQAFTCEAGNRVMGFPKTVERLEVTYADERVSFHLWMDGEPTLVVSMPRAEATGPSERVGAVSYSYLDGVPYATDLQMGMGTGFVDPGEVTIEIGTGVVADELRSLGLPTTPDLATWGEGLSATFFAGRPVER